MANASCSGCELVPLLIIWSLDPDPYLFFIFRFGWDASIFTVRVNNQFLKNGKYFFSSFNLCFQSLFLTNYTRIIAQEIPELGR